MYEKKDYSGGVLMAVGTAAVIWILSWVYSLFQ